MSGCRHCCVSCPCEPFARLGAKHEERLRRWSSRVRRDAEEANSSRLRLDASSCPGCRVDSVSAAVDDVGAKHRVALSLTDFVDINTAQIFVVRTGSSDRSRMWRRSAPRFVELAFSAGQRQTRTSQPERALGARLMCGTGWCTAPRLCRSETSDGLPRSLPRESHSHCPQIPPDCESRPYIKYLSIRLSYNKLHNYATRFLGPAFRRPRLWRPRRGV